MYYELVIYGPFFSYLCGMNISYDDQYNIKVNEYTLKKILCIGGVTTFGAGVTSSSSMLGNILTRKYPVDVINISFHWWDWFENMDILLERMFENIKDSELIIFECDSANLPFETFRDNFSKILLKLLNKTNAKIVLWNQPILSQKHMNEEREALVRRIIEEFNERYSKRLAFCNNYFCWTSREYDMYAHNINYLNDNGNVWLYKRIEKYVEELCQNI